MITLFLSEIFVHQLRLIKKINDLQVTRME